MENIKNDYKTELNKNGVIAFVPGGNSMWPILKNRGQSVIVKVKTERLKVYDVAFYQRANGSFVLHRVMELIDGGYVMLGDSQFEKEKVKEEQVFGVMQGFYHGKKYIETTDAKYLKKVAKWHGNIRKRKIVLKWFYFWLRVKNKLKRIFSKKGN